MNDYKEIIKYLNEAKDAYLKDVEPLTYINLALIELAKLDKQQEIEINQMGKDYWKEFEDNTGTLRSTINDLDNLTGGQLKSTWSEK